MALNITGVRTDLAAAITAGCGLRTSVYESENINTPVGIVSLGTFDPRMVFGKAKNVYPFTVTVYAGSASVRASQVLIDGYREPSGSGSLTEAVEDESNWTEAIDYAVVTSNGAPVEQTIADQVLLVAQFEIEVCF